MCVCVCVCVCVCTVPVQDQTELHRQLSEQGGPNGEWLYMCLCMFFINGIYKEVIIKHRKLMIVIG